MLMDAFGEDISVLIGKDLCGFYGIESESHGLGSVDSVVHGDG